jgi:methyl-accepting chemotaxis protein
VADDITENKVIEHEGGIAALAVLVAAIREELNKLCEEFNAHVESNRTDFTSLSERLENESRYSSEISNRLSELVDDLEAVADEVDAAAEAAEEAADIAEEAVEAVAEEVVEEAEAASVEEAVAEEPKPEEHIPQRRKKEFVSLWRRG